MTPSLHDTLTNTTTVLTPLPTVTAWALAGAMKVKVRLVPTAGASPLTVPAVAVSVKADARAVIAAPARRGVMVQTDCCVVGTDAGLHASPLVASGVSVTVTPTVAKPSPTVTAPEVAGAV